MEVANGCYCTGFLSRVSGYFAWGRLTQAASAILLRGFAHIVAFDDIWVGFESRFFLIAQRGGLSTTPRAVAALELLAGAMVKLTDHKSLSHETVRRRLAENDLDRSTFCPMPGGRFQAVSDASH
jgi:hypothetical protein